mgnify:CR=1 FL=1
MAIEEIRAVGDGSDSVSNIGLALKDACMNHFVQFLGQTGLGIGYGSCTAAVAIVEHPQYDTVNVGEAKFSVIYGMSQMFKGLDPDFNRLHENIDTKRNFSDSKDNQEHAEQSAIRTAIHMGRQFFAHDGLCHLYVDYNPCEHCEPWLRARPERWIVHHLTTLDDQKPAQNAKKQLRKKHFGRITEPKA